MSIAKIKNMEEFAAASGISRPTVSKYFNDPDSVRKSTRQKIEAALERFDYRPNIYAMNQNRRLTKNIGVVVPYLVDPFFGEIARNMEALVVAEGYRPILLSSHGQPQEELGNLESLRSIKPAGVLLAPLGRLSDHDQVRAFCKDIPTVLFDADIDGAGEAFIGSNNTQSIGMMVDYLCRSGAPPAFLEMKHPPNPNAFKRQSAYISAMERFDHEPEMIQVTGEGWDFEEIGFRGATEAITGGGLRSDTILCSNDRLAIGVLSAAYELGMRVGIGPDCALRVAGHDNHPFAQYTCPKLTTASQDYAAIADMSARSLFALIESQNRAPSRQTTLFDAKLIMRGSA